MNLAQLPNWLVAVAALVVLVVALWIVAKIFGRRRKPEREMAEARPDISVGRLGQRGPRPSGPCLEIRGIPVRVAAVVMARLGRGTEVPRVETWPPLLDTVVPGLAEVVRLDQPLLRPWPGQISREGFTHSVCSAAALPGDRGRDTPWCMVTGKIVVDGTPFMVGIVGCAAKPNSLIPIVVEDEGKWADVLRVRSLPA